MSIQIMTAIWDKARCTGTQLLALLALADHANDDGVCWPSIPRIAARCRVTQRRMMDIIAALETAGYIQVQRARGCLNHYLITRTGEPCFTREADSTPEASFTTAPEASFTTAPEADCRGPVKLASPEPSLTAIRTLNRTIKGARARGQSETAPLVPPPLEEAAVITVHPGLPAPPSATQGRAVAGRLATLNAKVGPELRIPLVDELLNITGLRQLADTSSADGERVLAQAHETVVTLYQIGLTTPEALLRVEEAWYASWQGRGGSKPTMRQFVEFASGQQQGARRKAQKGGNHAAQSHADAGHREPTAAEREQWRELQRQQAAAATAGRKDLPTVQGDALPGL